MKKFQDIEQFRHVAKNVSWKAQFVKLDENNEPIMNRLAILPKLTFEGTVKIHGCCSSIRVEGDKIYKVTTQSRNNEISPEKDNYGFAKFVTELPDEVFDFFKKEFGNDIVIHGEWAGQGIQDTVAVCQLPKFWTVFAVQPISDEFNENYLSLENKDFTVLNKYHIFNIRQFGVEKVEINFESPAEGINKLNELSLAVENECPVGKYFGISGIGEGRVWKCINEGYNSSKFIFKVKGQAHSKSKVKKLANVDVEKMKSIEDFVDKHLTEERLIQGFNWLKEQGKNQDEKSTGDFIRWIFNDILKEEKDELEASNLTEKDLGSIVAKKAKNWYFEKIK